MARATNETLSHSSLPSTRPRAGLTVGFAVLFTIFGIVAVLLTGILSMQIEGARTGAVFGLDNALVGISEPHIPLLQLAAVAAIGTLVAFALLSWIRAKAPVVQFAASLAYALSSGALVAWALVMAPATLPTGDGSPTTPEGLTGWVLRGGTNSVVHVLLLLAICSAIAALTRRSPEREAGTDAS